MTICPLCEQECVESFSHKKGNFIIFDYECPQHGFVEKITYTKVNHWFATLKSGAGLR